MAGIPDVTMHKILTLCQLSQHTRLQLIRGMLVSECTTRNHVNTQIHIAATPTHHPHHCTLLLTLQFVPQTCEGSGVKAGTTPSSCPQCQGTGTVIQVVRTPLGAFQQVSGCPRCEGGGQIFIPCDKCSGDGRIRDSKRISLKVPAGGLL